MINHGRSLLLNSPGNTQFNLNTPGEEIIDRAFTPFVWPPVLQPLRSLLFSADPDRPYLNFRLRQLLATIHGSGLGDWLAKLDPRITYWPILKDDFTPEAFLPSSRLTAGPGTAILSFQNQAAADDQRGRMFWEWQVVREAGVQTTITWIAPNQDPVVATPTVTDGLTAQVALPGGSGLKIVTADANATWQLSALARPQRSLLMVMSDIFNNLDAAMQTHIFGNAVTEPYQSAQAYWTTGAEPLLRFGWLLVALIYRLEDRRTR